MPTIKTSTGGMDILDSGSLLAFSSTSDIQFKVMLNDTFGFDLILKFESNGESRHSIQSNIIGNTITFTCINFDSTLGTGTAAPIELAVFDGKKVYINFWVYSLAQNSAREISYTLYKEK